VILQNQNIGDYWCAWVFLVLYIILLPLFITLILKKTHKEELLEFLHNNYKDRFWWFEGLLWLRQVLICVCVVLIPDEFWTYIVLMACMIFSIVLVVLLDPFDREHHTADYALEIFSACTIIFTIFVCVLQLEVPDKIDAGFILVIVSCSILVLFY